MNQFERTNRSEPPRTIEPECTSLKKPTEPTGTNQPDQTNPNEPTLTN